MQYLACRNSFDNVSVPIIQKTIATKRLEHLEKHCSRSIHFCFDKRFDPYDGIAFCCNQTASCTYIVGTYSDYILSWKVQRFVCSS